MLIDIFHFGGEYYNTVGSQIDWIKLIGTILSGLTLYLAFKIYKNWDVKKHFIKKQLDTVFDLVNEIESTTIVINVHKNGSTITLAWRLSEIHEMTQKIIYEDLLNNRNAIMSDGIVNHMKFTQYNRNPFLPRSIAEELMKIHRLRLHLEDSNVDLENFVVLSKSGEILDMNFTKKNIMQIANPEFQTIGSYFKQVIVIKAAIITWLKGFDVKELNINTEYYKAEDYIKIWRDDKVEIKNGNK